MKRKTILFGTALIACSVLVFTTSPPIKVYADEGGPTTCSGPQCDTANGHYYRTHDTWVYGFYIPICCGEATDINHVGCKEAVNPE